MTGENRLKNSASPYLRSAAHQPIDWHEWGEAAFEKARAEQKPVLLDIGAVWCHWCHVIDRESYENPEIARLINELYVAVKVDRDERPDVDSRYQTAVSALSGQGGWPLTAFLTPEGKPFFGGTYFPPEDTRGRPGFKRVLVTIAEAFEKRRADVNKTAESLAQAIAKAAISDGARGDFDARVIESVVESAARSFDHTHGGFGQAPKFPHPAILDLLMERAKWPGGDPLIEVVGKTLSAMAAGGFHDQIGGGFHRYSVDERWCVPHFEKMSYDNSELLKNYLHGWQLLGRPELRAVAEDILAWVAEVLSDPERGGFWASQDADQSLDDDGDYFTWTLDELRAVLTPDEARVTELYYDVGENGEMHHNPRKNVLWIAQTPAAIAEKLAISERSVSETIARAKQKMHRARNKREPQPAVDRTIYVSWNAMFVSAYLEAASVLGRSDCRAFALKSCDRLLREAWSQASGFLHRAGGPALEGSLDDQVFGAAALLDAFETTLDPRYLAAARRTIDLALERFGDPDGGGFFDRAKDARPLGGLDLRRKPFEDSPTPGANAVAAMVLDRIYGFTGEKLYHQWAEKTLEAFVGLVPQYGLFAGTYALASLLHARHALTIVITGASDDPGATALERAAHQVYRVAKAVLRLTPERLAGTALPAALAETLGNLDAHKAQALLCVETTCFAPTGDPAALASLLETTGIPQLVEPTFPDRSP